MRNTWLDYLGLATVAGVMVWLLTLCQCTPDPVQPSNHPGCIGACEQGAALGCSWAQASPKGVPCVDWCSSYHAVGYMRPWADCAAQAGDADAVRACGISCEEP